MVPKTAIWACSARCVDGKDRTVLALYRGEKTVLVQRPWIAPTTTLLLEPKLQRFVGFLRDLISVADYHAYKGVWYGEVAVDWRALSAISGGLGRNSIDTYLKAMSRADLILYRPGHSWTRPPLIRIYPYQRTTGIHLIEPEASWLRSFVTKITPKTVELEIEPQAKSINTQLIRRLTATVAQNSPCNLVSEAPIYVTEDSTEPNSWALCKVLSILPGNADIIRTICGVPGLEDFANMNCGVDPAVGYHSSEPVTPESVAKARIEDSVNWRSEWSENGISVVVAKDFQIPAPGDLGVVPSWELASDDINFPQSPSRGQVPSEGQEAGADFSQSPQRGLWVPTDNDTNQLNDISIKSDCDVNQLNDISIKSDCDVNQLTGLTIKCSLQAEPSTWALAGGAGAPVAGRTAPAPGAMPSASSDYIRAKSKRQLNQEQLSGLYRQRGPRLTDEQREERTTKEVSCIETYERLTGVPFCRDDVKFLENALTLTSHDLVLRGISYASKWPEPPGYYVVKNGFAHVLRAIEKNKFLHLKAKKSRDRVKVGSGISDVKEKARDYKRADPAPGRAVPSQDSSAPEKPAPAPSAAPAPEATAGKVFVSPVKPAPAPSPDPAPEAMAGKVFVPPVREDRK
jgi:hypothetical protein